MNATKRLEVILAHLGKRKNTLAKELGYINSGIFNHILSGRNGISPKLAQKICSLYPEINEKWVLTGKGDMLHDLNVNNNDANYILTQLKGISKRLDQLEELNKRLERLENTITSIEKKIKS
jgi:plasmid maintenance system antidote protein VapI